ncbi:sugar-specific transcriptional regulator TrmB [Scopulibacillus daqui]|uniref:Sugar-specific transcriptional regulator TrmB n=1 Tax=Scopulibacillus daqui TaxID=1469162 RepID=A0ABS2PV44_9BACL|nr:sugar-specific transcriptional regulator TrmB [Scopulibacillus daqui]
MNDISEALQLLGFNQYQSKTYLALVYLGTSSAYQVSKQSGVPRSRIYEVLEGLEQKGVVIKEEVNGTVQYSPLPVDVFLESIKQQWEETYSSVKKELKRFEKQDLKADPRVTTIKGGENILSFCRTLLRRAKHRIIVSIWDAMYEHLADDLRMKQENCSLKGIVFQVENPLPDLVVHRQTDYIDNIGENKWFIISIDGREMIYGHPVERNGNAFYTDDVVHVSLLENYIWHDVLVNRLVEQSRENLQNWISSERKKFFKL